MISLTTAKPLSQERPCNRCVKRSIGHLCHDEPRELLSSSSRERNKAVGDCAPTLISGPHRSDPGTSQSDISPESTGPTERTILEACSPSAVSTSQGDFLKLRSSTKGRGVENRPSIPLQHCKFWCLISLWFTNNFLIYRLQWLGC